MNTKDEIDQHIIDIIEHNDITEQTNLCEHLLERGFEVPQSTISRKLHRLKISKISGTYKIIHPNAPQVPEILRIKHSDSSLIVLHTHPAQAGTMAYIIDTHELFSNPELGILGTIAGDDTVLVITQNPQAQQRTLELLHKTINPQKTDTI